MQLGFIAWAAARSHFRLHVSIPRWTPQVREFLWALAAATIGSASIQISVFIDRSRRQLPARTIRPPCIMRDRINQLPTGVLAIAMGTVLAAGNVQPVLAKNELASAYESQNRAGAFGLLLTLPFVAAFLPYP